MWFMVKISRIGYTFVTKSILKNKSLERRIDLCVCVCVCSYPKDMQIHTLHISPNQIMQISCYYFVVLYAYIWAGVSIPILNIICADEVYVCVRARHSIHWFSVVFTNSCCHLLSSSFFFVVFFSILHDKW